MIWPWLGDIRKACRPKPATFLKGGQFYGDGKMNITIISLAVATVFFGYAGFMVWLVALPFTATIDLIRA
jgi:hypothetical protein